MRLPAQDAVVDLGLDRDGTYSVQGASPTFAGLLDTVQARPVQTLIVLGGAALLGSLLYDGLRPSRPSRLAGPSRPSRPARPPAKRQLGRPSRRLR